MNKFDLMGYLTGKSAAFDIRGFAIAMIVALLIGLYMYVVYKIAFRGAIFNSSIAFTIMSTVLVTTIIMITISFNLALSLGMVGALSIIRFRNPVKDPRDISFIFWSVAAGVALGAGSVPVAVLGSLFVGICFTAFSYLIKSSAAFLLVVKYGDKITFEEIINTVKEHTKHYKLKMKNTAINECEVIFEVSLKDETLVEALSQTQGVLAVNLIASTESV